MKKKHSPKSEAAQREAIKGIKGLILRRSGWKEDPGYIIEAVEPDSFEVVAIFDLRDCYRKRAPLKGITKAVRKAVQPRRKKR